ncbi:bifunctional 5,10-methylenetetrahydrofolate dehydrogenase/5,10-methenyltetrahydrofolate cyclohydrolase [Candidatus Saccharibacteria bacterium]|nr:bifunctional 5,10-methylenetetrahydrofolate dehydrogenase/5,10-methenyltetrahydrofolate cyclohydrolase [Candidatus Saccharibacteria bacterium]
MKLLDGKELAGYIQERQARQVRALRQAARIFPRLAIVQTLDDPVINSYIRLKRRYAEETLVELEHHLVPQSEAEAVIRRLNDDDAVHGIIIQLPLTDPADTERFINLVAPHKDIDGLGAATEFTPATAMAINWLLAGYNIALERKQLLIVGRGKLVGGPLERLWQQSGLSPVVVDDQTPEADFLQQVRGAEVIVTATGTAGLITSQMLSPGTVVVDAGVASEAGRLVGDVASDVRLRDDLIITPEKGGVGPLTVCALFDNVIQAARRVADAAGQ